MYLALEHYIVNQIVLAFFVVLTYDLISANLDDRHIDDVINISFLSL